VMSDKIYMSDTHLVSIISMLSFSLSVFFSFFGWLWIYISDHKFTPGFMSCDTSTSSSVAYIISKQF